jgi:hypothetical protein
MDCYQVAKGAGLSFMKFILFSPSRFIYLIVLRLRRMNKRKYGELYRPVSLRLICYLSEIILFVSVINLYVRIINQLQHF